MKKSTLILSSILTGVILALLVILVSSYRKIVSGNTSGDGAQAQAQTQELAQAQQSIQLTAPLAEATLAAENGNVEIYDAPVIAAKVLGHDDVYITEYAKLNDADVYLVSFLSGDLVYVSLAGQVISASKQTPITLSQPASHR
jgi:hypothetical protein